MRSKKTLIFLMCSLIFILILSINYLRLKRDYNNLLNDKKYYLTSNLIRSVGISNSLDLNKVISNDKKSIMSLINMYEYISNSNAILMIGRSGDSAIYDPFILDNYREALKNIINKSINGELEAEDKNKLNIITEDLKLIYKFVRENDNTNYDKFNKEVKSKLKLKSSL